MNIAKVIVIAVLLNVFAAMFAATAEAGAPYHREGALYVCASDFQKVHPVHWPAALQIESIGFGPLELEFDLSVDSIGAADDWKLVSSYRFLGSSGASANMLTFASEKERGRGNGKIVFVVKKTRVERYKHLLLTFPRVVPLWHARLKDGEYRACWYVNDIPSISVFVLPSDDQGELEE